ncbi:MAG: FxLYD domain-containing protein [Candidatus Rokuibacteriota bacterium]
MNAALLGLGTAVILLASAGPIVGPVRAAELYAPETLDRYFKLEWSREGRNVNGYVYNTGNRRAAHMILLVEGLDGAGKTVAKTTTWVRDVPPNNRAFFEVAVPTAAAYRVSVQSFDWVEDRLDRRKAW